MEFPNIVELNVGGRYFTTSLTTLTKYPDSMLAAMFSGRHPVSQDKDGRYFIDVNGDVFEHILDFLRIDKLPPPEAKADVKEHAEYFALNSLKHRLDEVPISCRDDLYATWKSGITHFDIYLQSVNKKLKKLYAHLSIDTHVRLIVLAPTCRGRPCPYAISLRRPHEDKYTDRILVITTDRDAGCLVAILVLLQNHLQRIGITTEGSRRLTNCFVEETFKILT